MHQPPHSNCSNLMTPSAALASALRLDRSASPDRPSAELLPLFGSVFAQTGRDPAERKAPLVISRAAFRCGAEKVVRLLAPPGAELRGLSPSEVGQLARSAEHMLLVAADAAWLGATRRSLPCMAQLIALFGQLGAVGSQAPARLLAALQGMLAERVQWGLPRDDLPPRDTVPADGIRGPSPLEIFMEVRNHLVAEQLNGSRCCVCSQRLGRLGGEGPSCTLVRQGPCVCAPGGGRAHGARRPGGGLRGGVAGARYRGLRPGGIMLCLGEASHTHTPHSACTAACVKCLLAARRD